MSPFRIGAIMGIEIYDELARLVGEARAQYQEFINGKKVAATRARKALQDIKSKAQEARIEIQAVKKGVPPPAEGAPPAAPQA
jgi:hypothetical protein